MMGGVGCSFSYAAWPEIKISSLHQLPGYSSFICLDVKSSVCRKFYIAQCCHHGAGFAKMADPAGTVDIDPHLVEQRPFPPSLVKIDCNAAFRK